MVKTLRGRGIGPVRVFHPEKPRPQSRKPIASAPVIMVPIVASDLLGCSRRKQYELNVKCHPSLTWQPIVNVALVVLPVLNAGLAPLTVAPSRSSLLLGGGGRNSEGVGVRTG